MLMNVRGLDKALYYVLLFLAFSSCISIAGVNIAVGVAAIIALVRFFQEPVVIEVDKGLLRAIGLFFLAMLLSVFFADNKWLGITGLSEHMLRTLPFFLAALGVRDSRQLVGISAMMVVSIGISDGYAIWQGLQGDYRAQAFASHPMILAGYLIQMIPLILVFGWQIRPADKVAKVFYFTAFCLSMAALIVNGTRGAWISVGSFLALFAVWYGKENRRRLAGLLLVLLVSLAGVVYSPDVHARLLTITDMHYESNSERLLIWHSAGHMFLDHPLTGVGIGNFTELYQHRYISPKAQDPALMHAHNNFLQMLAEMGSIGLAAFIYMFGYILVLAYRQSVAQKQTPWSAVLFFATVCLLVQGLTEYNFGDSAVIHLYWFILGLSCAAWKFDNHGHNPV